MTNKEYQILAKKGREERAAQYDAEMRRRIDSVDFYTALLENVKRAAEVQRERGNHERYCDYMRVLKIARDTYHDMATTDSSFN